MYARLVLITLGADMRSTAERLADQFNASLQALQGFRGATFLADEVAGEYGSLSLWETRADAEAVRRDSGSEIKRALKGIAKGPPRIRLFEVYEPS